MNNCLHKIPQRTLKDACDRIIGGGDKLKGALRRIVLAYQKKPKDAFDLWKKWLDLVKNKQVVDRLTAQRLLTSLNSIPQRTLKDACDRIIGEGDKLKGALRRLEIKLKDNRNSTFYKWLNWLQLVKQKKLLDEVKT